MLVHVQDNSSFELGNIIRQDVNTCPLNYLKVFSSLFFQPPGKREGRGMLLRGGNSADDIRVFLKALDTIGNCQRPVFSLGVSQHMHIITNL